MLVAVLKQVELFFDCDFARAFWFSSDPPIRTHLPQDQDGVQEAIAAVLSHDSPPDRIQKFFSCTYGKHGMILGSTTKSGQYIRFILKLMQILLL